MPPFYHSISIANIILSIPNSFLFSSHPFYHFLSLPCFIIIYPTTSTTAIYSPSSPPHITQYCISRQPPSLYQNPFFSPLSSPPKYIYPSFSHISLTLSQLLTVFLRLLFFVLSIYATDHRLLAMFRSSSLLSLSKYL